MYGYGRSQPAREPASGHASSGKDSCRVHAYVLAWMNRRAVTLGVSERKKTCCCPGVDYGRTEQCTHCGCLPHRCPRPNRWPAGRLPVIRSDELECSSFTVPRYKDSNNVDSEIHYFSPATSLEHAGRTSTPACLRMRMSRRKNLSLLPVICRPTLLQVTDREPRPGTLDPGHTR